MSSKHFEHFIKTATAEEMDLIRESLSNFQDVSKNFSNVKIGQDNADKGEDDYIEEEFEEDIPEDDGEDEDSDPSFEVIKKAEVK